MFKSPPPILDYCRRNERQEVCWERLGWCPQPLMSVAGEGWDREPRARVYRLPSTTPKLTLTQGRAVTNDVHGPRQGATP